MLKSEMLEKGEKLHSKAEHDLKLKNKIFYTKPDYSKL